MLTVMGLAFWKTLFANWYIHNNVALFHHDCEKGKVE